MARLLIAALERAGHQVEVASEMRTFMKQPSPDMLAERYREAQSESDRISALWRKEKAPDLWFTYHCYYKAPDLLGPDLCKVFGIPYATAEASYSIRRNTGVWEETQSKVLQAVEQAAVNICLTGRDRQGLADALPSARLAMLPPFLDPAAFLVHAPRPRPNRLITVAMMRAGDKMDSYGMLAESLMLLSDLPWTLSIVGDGPFRQETEAMFAGFDKDRVEWHGEKDRNGIAALLSESAVYVWPGCGEAYGLAYLEAQAAGLPVVAQATAGVPEVVLQEHTGLLTPAGDAAAFADAIRRLLTDAGKTAEMAAGARRFVREERSLDQAAIRLATILKQHVRHG